ncbi:succinic semialdehyde dehydrogenase [Corynebacterium efficiens YS-314]|nr:succinic semialdehyde dehydrogenase [Corynebacterium efficiens]EEW50243.1 succinic semialdehyde dehydrogenase [Corynebacterium efficiens YS-314]
MYPPRLTPGPLPRELEEHLRGLITSEATPTIPVEAPFDATTIGHVPEGGQSCVDKAFSLAREAQRGWEDTPHATRRSIVRTFHSLVLKHRELLMDMVQLETGKNRAAAFDEVMDVASTARYYAARAEKLLTPRRRQGTIPVLSSTVEHRYPLGVIGQISPWNYPLTLAISDAIPALLAGNAVVSKPDERTPFTALLVTSLLYDAGLPRDIFHTVTGPGPVVGGAIAEHCDYLMFTGSTNTGRILGETAGRRLIGFSAELGGKNPLIIAEDADLDKAVDGAVHGTISNSGQLCVSIERIFVVGSMYPRFVDAYVQRLQSIRMEAGFDWDVEMGSLASQQQLDTVTRMVDEAVSKGAEVLTGGRARPDLGPYFYEPTVLTGVTKKMELYRHEVFGPVVYVEAVADLAEAIVYANDTDYGLNAGIFAARDTALAAAPLIRVGGVNINDSYSATWGNIDTPLGGAKDSGLSARHGEEGLLKYTQTQNISEQRYLQLRGPRSLKRKTYASLMTAGLKALAVMRR